MTPPSNDTGAVPPGRWLTALGGLLLVMALIALGASSAPLVADGPGDAAEQALPKDLEHVAADAAGFIALRPAELWTSPVVKAWRARLAKEDPEFAGELDSDFLKDIQLFLGVPLAKVERLTVVLPRSQTWPLLSWPMAVRTTEPYDRDKVLATLDGGDRRRGRGVLLRFLDDRSYALAMPQQQAAGTVLSKREEAALRTALALAGGKHLVTAGLLPSGVLDLLSETVFRHDSLIGPFLISTHPLFLAESATLTLDVDDDARLELRLNYAKESTAATGEEVAQAVLRMLARSISRQIAQAEQMQSQSDEMLKIARRLLGALQDLAVEQQGKSVRAGLELKEDQAIAVLNTTARLRVATSRVRSVNNLRQIAIAMHNYHDTYGHFPPAVATSREGKPLYSWRVLLLPFMEEQPLYSQFKLDEPWDSPNNKPLLARIPKVYQSPRGKPADSAATYYQVLVGGGALFDLNRPTRMADITDGTSNTILVIEAGEPVPWSKPEDLTYDPQEPLPKFGGIFKEGFNAAFADAAVHFLPRDTDEKRLRAWITRSGNEVVLSPGTSDGNQMRMAPPGVMKKTIMKMAPARPPEIKK